MLMALHNLAGLAAWPDGRYVAADWFVERSRAGAAELLRHGASPADKILITHGGTAAFFADLFSVWRVGACAVCINPGLTTDELQNVCNFVSPKAALVADTTRTPQIPDVSVLCLNDSNDCSPLANDTDCGGHLDDDALILFTSGTTGVPKGVVHTFRSLLARMALNTNHIGKGAMARSLCVLPTHFGHGLIGNCLTPMLSGQELLLAPGGNLDVIANLSDIIDEHEITFMSSVPSFWKKVLKSSKPPSKGTLLRLHIGSAPLSKELWNDVADWAGTRAVYNMYGITETANWLAGRALGDDGAEDGAIGEMWGGDAAVLTGDGEIAFMGTGEILVQTPSLMKGYFQRPELTQEVLKDGWFRTGDIGTIDKSGKMRLVGRQKYEINRGGMKVHPEDIDIMLERHEAVREACAFSVPHEIEGETVAVAVSLVGNAGVTIKDLRKWSVQHLVREKLPEHWFIVDEIPKTDRGKINRDDVAAYCRRNGSTSA